MPRIIIYGVHGNQRYVDVSNIPSLLNEVERLVGNFTRLIGFRRDGHTQFLIDPDATHLPEDIYAVQPLNLDENVLRREQIRELTNRRRRNRSRSRNRRSRSRNRETNTKKLGGA